MFKSRTLAVATALALCPAAAFSADPNFVEADVDVVATLLTEQPGSSFGWVAEDLGDISGDGATDFIVTAPFLVDGGGNSTGRIYLYSGADGALLATHTGNAGELLGFSASLAGNLDGDGVNDYVAGSRVRLVAYSGADHSVLWEIAPPQGIGFDVDTAGDVTGDGIDEIIAGATGTSVNGGNSGAAYLLDGNDGSVLWQFNGSESFDLAGSAVGRLGDVSGDGVPDVLVGVRGGGHKNRGIAFALSGVDGSVLYEMAPVGRSAVPGGSFGTFATFHAAGGRDVDGDGIGDVFIGDFGATRGQQNPNRGGGNANAPTPVGGTGRAYVFSGADGTRLHVINAENNGDGIGPGRLVGDADGDGLADIYVAAFTFGPNAEGKAYLYSGADLSLLRTMTGTQPGIFLGVDALGLADVNFDGIPDYLLTGFEVVHIIAGN
ncbi:integrin alpha [Elongatibacter sediminis]|uniref:Integrin alpha n=1 Tax=Elongatibacter sediminis TaxID=3119006 RepID=A0AAW9R908_9GAMM